MKIALVHRDHPRHTDKRMIGMWSYAVPEFQVTRVAVPKHFILDRRAFADHDVIVWEDARTVGTVIGDAPVPVVYCVGDSTLSDAHYQHRYQQAAQADLILVDWDELDRFTALGKPARRLSYSVNEQLFKPLSKSVDVGFFQHPTDERAALDFWLAAFCAERGYSYASGSRADLAYCAALGTAKININLNRNPQTRAHRCYDALAARSCLVTSPMPYVSGEFWRPNTHFVEWRDYDDLAWWLDSLLPTGRWQRFAADGFDYVMAGHTWAKRAQQLHALLLDVFPRLQERAYAHTH